jgi:hypothetical protein
VPLSCVMRGYTRTVYARSSDEAFAPAYFDLGKSLSLM